MPAPCPTCFPVTCDVGADDSLYNFQQSAFPFVLNCPPGFSCGDAGSFRMVCCGQEISVDFPPNATVSQKTLLIQQVVNQCNARLALCGQQPGCLNPPCDTPPPTIQLYYNRDATCASPCPDGTVFQYTVVAGTFAAMDQATADQEALDYACQQAELRRMCLGNFFPCGCVGTALSVQIPHSGGIAPIVFELTGGSFPPGLHLSTSGVISGTPIVPGSFTFNVTAISGGGGFVVKPFTMTFLQITSTELPAFTVGVPYSYQLLVVGGSGSYRWKITAGTLPPGLTMSNTGLISGTPI